MFVVVLLVLVLVVGFISDEVLNRLLLGENLGSSVGGFERAMFFVVEKRSTEGFQVSTIVLCCRSPPTSR